MFDLVLTVAAYANLILLVTCLVFMVMLLWRE